MLLAALLVPVAVAAGDFRFTPSLEWLETWTSNATGANDGSRVSPDLLSSAAPHLLVESQGARVGLRADLGLRYTHYAANSAAPELDRLVDAAAHADPLPGLLGVDAAANARRVNQSLLAPQSSEGLGANPNQSQVRSWSVTPHLDSRFSDLAHNHLVLAHSDFASDAGGGAFDSRSDSLDETLSTGTRFHTVAGSLELYHRRYDFRLAPGISESRVMASADLRLDGALHAIASAGHEGWSLPSAIEQVSGTVWQAGLRWQPSLLDSAEITAGHRFFGRTFGVDATHHGRLGYLAVHFHEDVDTTQSAFQLPAGADAVDFLASLLAPTVADPAARAQLARNLAGQLHLAGAGGADEGFVTTSTYLHRRLDVKLGVQGPRSTLMATAFADGRANLAGLQQTSIGDFNSSHSIHTAGVGLGASLHLSPRMVAGAGLQSTRAEFDDIGRTDHQDSLNAGVSRTLDRDTTASLQAVRVVRDSNVTGAGYHESTFRVSFVHRF